MEKLIYKYTSISNAAARLKEALDEFKTYKKGAYCLFCLRNSSIED
jgi:hypothetical protein